jgi:alpha-1,2-mannosyltransferase
VATGALLVAVTVLATGVLVALRSDRAAVDVRVIYLPAAHAVLDGESPYPGLDDPSLDAHRAFFYPPQIAYAFTPLTLLPADIAAVVALLACAGLLVATLAVLGVRDVRCYAAAFLWGPTWQELDMANISAAIAFALALAWRYRGRELIPGVALGVAVAAKLFVWPVLGWTLAARRYSTTVLAIAVSAGVTIAAWALLGFAGLAGYPALVRKVDSLYAGNSWSLVGTAMSLGLGSTIGHVLSLVVGLLLLVGCLALGRRGDEQGSFTLAIGASLALTPIVWLHYLVLLLVPMAIARPRFTPLWLLPIVLWFGPHPLDPRGVLNVMPVLVTGVILFCLVRRPVATDMRGDVAVSLGRAA